MSVITRRTTRRLLRHHLTIALVGAAALAAFYAAVQSKDVKFRASMATGYVGLALLAATLTTGAVDVLRARRNPVSTDLRRDLGIWCGVVSLAHVVIGLQVHMGNMLLYFLRAEGGTGRLVARSDLFGFANYTGLAAALVIVFLLALSNDASLRLLGGRRWKFWQRWNYVVIVSVVSHGIAYQLVEKRRYPYVVLFGVIAGAVLVLQALGFRRRRRREKEGLTAQDRV